MINHEDQRYDTCGDWQFKPGFNSDRERLVVTVSDTGDDYMNYLLADHEIREAMLCRRKGITSKEADEYDEAHPATAGNDTLSDNGDSPYYEQHGDALAIEWLTARLLGIDWRDYTLRLGEIMEKGGK